MKRALFSACIVMVCSAFAWGAMGLPNAADQATTDEPIVKIIKIGDQEKGAPQKCGKTCGKRPCDKPNLGSDVLYIQSDPCAGCDKKCDKKPAKGKAACCPVTGICVETKQGKAKAAGCPVTGACSATKCDSTCGTKCSCGGKCGTKCGCGCGGNCAAKCGSQCKCGCGGKCAAKCGSTCGMQCGSKCAAKCGCGGQCATKCGGKCATTCGSQGQGKCKCKCKCDCGRHGKKPHKAIEREEIVIHLSDIPGHEGLQLGEDAEVRVMVLGDESPLKFYGDHGKKKHAKKAHRIAKYHKNTCEKSASCADRSHGCKPRAYGHKGCDCGCGCDCSCCDGKSCKCKGHCKSHHKAHRHCKSDCRSDCCDDCSCHGRMGGDVRGMIVIMLNHDGSYSVKTVGDCGMGEGHCPVMKGLHHGFGHHGNKACGCGCGCRGDCGGHKGHAAKRYHGDKRSSCHHGEKSGNCHGKCHDRVKGHGCHGSKHGHDCKDKCDHHKKERKGKHPGKKSRCKTSHGASSCGRI